MDSTNQDSRAYGNGGIHEPLQVELLVRDHAAQGVDDHLVTRSEQFYNAKLMAEELRVCMEVWSAREGTVALVEVMGEGKGDMVEGEVGLGKARGGGVRVWRDQWSIVEGDG